MKQMFQGAALVLALSCALGPAQAADPDLVARAEAEGRVMWYTGLLAEEAARPMVEAFNAQYPKITAEFFRSNGGELSRRILAEADAPQADVFDSATTVAQIGPKGLIEPFVPVAAADIPTTYRDADGLWTAQVLYFTTVGYNTDRVAADAAPKSYDDLLDPRWKGRIGWASTGTASGVGFVANVLDQMGQEAGMDYLRRLAAQQIVVIEGGGAQALQAVADGRIDIGLSIFNHHTLIQAKKGGRVDWVRMEPLLSFPNPIGLIKDAPHPNAGKLFIEFVLSEQGQQILRDSDHVPASNLVEAPDPAIKTGFPVNFLTPERLEKEQGTWRRIVEEIFQ